ncbi:ATP-binding cassette domain-containing protein, partial [Bacillus sp. Hm123]|uniref:ATP-binding cassette domain-containing protein n=1 Tax=Bacillus sp. Hm123 TaxID=3450745 RepID=UPI003F433F69
RIMNGLIPYHYEGKLEGQVRLFGKDLLNYKKGDIAKYISNVFQNPSDQFFATIAEDEVALVGENLGMDYEVLVSRVENAFEMMDIKDLRKRKLNELSGGQKQKVAIASTLIYDTNIIFFDEPSASLDYEGIMQFKKTLKQLKEMGKTLIIAEHRLFFLKDLYDRMIFMEKGGIKKIFEKNELTETKCKELGLRTITYDNLQTENTINLKETTEEVRNVDIKIGSLKLIKNLSFDLHREEIMAIIGVNGVGKSTLGRVLTGLLGGREQISFGETKRKRLKNSYYMMQDVDYQIFFDTVENEMIPAIKKSDAEFLNRVKEILFKIDLWENRLQHPQELSGGQKQRLALANAFLNDRRVIELDEPTSGLDFKRMEKIAELIKLYAEKRPVIIITHDLELIFKICNTALLVDHSGYEKIFLKGNEKKLLNFMTDKIKI